MYNNNIASCVWRSHHVHIMNLECIASLRDVIRPAVRLCSTSGTLLAESSRGRSGSVRCFTRSIFKRSISAAQLLVGGAGRTRHSTINCTHGLEGRSPSCLRRNPIGYLLLFIPAAADACAGCGPAVFLEMRLNDAGIQQISEMNCEVIRLDEIRRRRTSPQKVSLQTAGRVKADAATKGKMEEWIGSRDCWWSPAND